MKTRADMVVAPRKVSFEESLKFAIIQMKIENPSIVFPDEWCNRIIEPTTLKLEGIRGALLTPPRI